MSARRTLLVGPRASGHVNGVSLCFELVVGEFARRQLPHEVVDTTGGAYPKRPGSLDLGRILRTLRTILDARAKVARADAVYQIISSSRLGFLRDSMILGPAVRAGKRVVLHLHGGGYREFYEGLPPERQAQVRRLLDGAERIIVLSETLRDQFAFLPRHEEQVAVVPNGLPRGLNPSGLTHKLHEPGQPFRVLYLSNLIPSKGYELVLEALGLLHVRGLTSVEADFCGQFRNPATEGDGDPEAAQERFLARIAALGLEGTVRYRGMVSGEDKERLLREAGALALPTTYPWEGQPLCIVEAMAFATPVVATRHKGIPEQVVDGHTGLLVEPENPEDLARGLRTLVDDVAQRRELGRKGQEAIHRHFHADRMARETLNVYQKYVR